MTVIAGPSRAEIRGRASGALILAWFGLVWTGWALSAAFPAAVTVAVPVVAGPCFVGLLAGAILVFRRSRTLPPGDAAGRAAGWRFGLIVAAEFIGIGIAARVLGALDRPELIPPIVCLGVGVHFFPLARLFHVPAYRVTGTVLCAIAVLTVILAPLLGRPVLWTALPGFGAALTLDSTAALLLRTVTRRLAAEAETAPGPRTA